MASVPPFWSKSGGTYKSAVATSFLLIDMVAKAVPGCHLWKPARLGMEASNLGVEASTPGHAGALVFRRASL